MRSNQINIFREILKQVGENEHLLPDEPLTGFLSMVGSKYNGDLMVVGRAVNEWSKEWRPKEMLDPRRRAEVIRETISSVSSDNCPMLWVSERWGFNEDYNTRKSAFWRVIRNTIIQLDLTDAIDQEWPSLLVWSNLYKVAPARGGNPSSKLCSFQEALCRDLLIAEIQEYKPKRVLFLTGLSWAKPFLSGWAQDVRRIPTDNFVEAIAVPASPNNAAECKIVVAAHPQGKNESKWVEEVYRSFNLKIPPKE